MQIHNGLLYTCSGDRTIRAFNLIVRLCRNSLKHVAQLKHFDMNMMIYECSLHTGFFKKSPRCCCRAGSVWRCLKVTAVKWIVCWCHLEEACNNACTQDQVTRPSAVTTSRYFDSHCFWNVQPKSILSATFVLWMFSDTRAESDSHSQKVALNSSYNFLFTRSVWGNNWQIKLHFCLQLLVPSSNEYSLLPYELLRNI